MRRRVIFPDPEIWTRKDNTMTALPSDHRRAAALIAHHRQSNTPGVNAVIEDANHAGRGIELVMSVMGTHQGLLGLLRTNGAVALMLAYVEQIATNGTADEPDPHLVQAAQLLRAHSREDFTTISDILGGEQPTHVFAKLLDLYEVLIPELTTPEGVDWLTRQAAAMAGLEDDAEGEQ